MRLALKINIIHFLSSASDQGLHLFKLNLQAYMLQYSLKTDSKSFFRYKEVAC